MEPLASSRVIWLSPRPATALIANRVLERIIVELTEASVDCEDGTDARWDTSIENMRESLRRNGWVRDHGHLYIWPLLVENNHEHECMKQEIDHRKPCHQRRCIEAQWHWRRIQRCTRLINGQLDALKHCSPTGRPQLSQRTRTQTRRVSEVFD